MERSILRGPLTVYERDASVGTVFDAAAMRTPDAIAVRDAKRSMSYAEVARRSNRFAHFLIARGVGAGARVGVAAERSVELPVLLLGILKTGAAYVPLDPGLPPERLALTLADAAVTYVVGATTVDVAGVVVLDLEREAHAIAAAPATPPTVFVSADDVAYVTYTSGSTGTPKGVEVVHRGIVRLVRGADYVSILPDDVFFMFAPLAFDASTFEVWGALLNGAALAIAPPGALTFSEIGACLRAFGVTILWLTAPLFGAIVRSDVTKLAGLRSMLTGGDVVAPDDARAFLRAFPNCELIDGYGPTENTTFSCCYRVPSADAIGATIPIGRPIANSTAYLLDEALRPVAPGATGELFVGGDGVARGYTDPKLTEQRFLDDPFASTPGARMYRTGDRARVREDGQLEFLGRLDRQVKVRGFRVELAEIEHALRSDPAVLEAAVTALCDASGETTLVAHVVADRRAAVDAARVRDRLARVVPSQMIPHRVEIVDEIPKKASGKLDRAEIERRAAKVTRRPAARRPNDVRGVERTLTTCWIEILGDDAAVTPDANFFDVGGDSLRLLALHERIVAEFGVEIALVDLFAYPTIRSLGEALVRRTAS